MNESNDLVQLFQHIIHFSLYTNVRLFPTTAGFEIIKASCCEDRREDVYSLYVYIEIVRLGDRTAVSPKKRSYSLKPLDVVSGVFSYKKICV